MAYVFPDEGFETENTQFMLGDEILVAPVLEKGAEERTIRLPNGRWRGGGNIIDGGRSITVKVGISDIPHFFRI